MVKILSLTVVQHPTQYTPVVLRPGDDLPSWATGLVTNPDVVGDQAGVSEADDPQNETETSPELPDSSWKNDDIRDFAEAREIDLGDASTKADMLQVIHDMLELFEQDAGGEDRDETPSEDDN